MEETANEAIARRSIAEVRGGRGSGLQDGGDDGCAGQGGVATVIRPLGRVGSPAILAGHSYEGGAG